MKFIVSGSEGFVGKHLVKYLQSLNHDVQGFDISKNAQNSIDLFDKEKLFSFIEQHKPDAIIHLAGFSSIRKSFDQPELCKKINVEGTRNLLDSIIAAKITPTVLMVTSADIYGKPSSNSIKETDPISPRTPYAISREQQEILCKEYFTQIPIIISRSFVHIGPGQDPTFVTADFARQISRIEKGEKEPTIKVGNLDAKRDFTDVRDMVKAYYLAIKHCVPGEIYNICSNNAYSINQILTDLLHLTNVKINIAQDPLRLRPSDIAILKGDNTKFTGATGWKPIIPLTESLQDILQYWRSQD